MDPTKVSLEIRFPYCIASRQTRVIHSFISYLSHSHGAYGSAAPSATGKSRCDGYFADPNTDTVSAL